LSKSATAIASPDILIPAPPLRSMVSTKLYPPRPRASLVARPDLIELLNSEPNHRLTVVCAPAGYGKSTLVAQWLAQLCVQSTWASLDTSDNTPRAFFSLIVAALQSIDEGLVAGTQTNLARPGPLDAETVARQLIEELSATTRPFVLVLDDFHSITAPEIHEATDLLLQNLPMMMRLVLISRTEPPLHLARLRAGGEVCELGLRDLSFSQAESLQFFQTSLNLDLAPSEVEILHQRTEGWVAGLYLAGFALRGQPRDRLGRYVEEFAGNSQFGNQYLWEEVLQNQPADVRAFLLRTSVLDRFNAELCDAVTASDGSEDLIRRCERDNLFILPLDDDSSWHRYHNLFAEVLRDRLTQFATDDEIDDLHRSASSWLETNGYLEDAIRHAIAGRVWDDAIRLLEVLGAALFERDHVVTLRAWLEGLPPEILERSPRLTFWLAWSLGRTGRWNEGNRLLRVSGEAWSATNDWLGQGLLLLWHACRSLYALENRKAIEYAERALDTLREDRAAERVIALMTQGIAHLYRGDPIRAEHAFADVRVIVDTRSLPWLQGFEMSYSAAVLVQQGKLRESTVLSRQVTRATGEAPSEIWVQKALLELGLVQFEWDMLDDAHRTLRRADELAETTRALQWRARIRTGLARIAWARGEYEDALDEIEQAISFANQLGTLQEVRSARAQQARFWIASHQVGLARRWSESCELDPYLPPEYERQVEHLTYVRLLILEERWERALEILGTIQSEIEASQRRGELVELHLLKALAYKTAGQIPEALQSLRYALELGEPSGYCRVFVDEGDELAFLLRHATSRGNYREYASRLLAAIEGTATVQQIDQRSTPDALSEREVEVLRLVAAGMANRDIGQRLFISEKTVKTHLSHILGKLEATNRTQAVDQARRLGVI